LQLTFDIFNVGNFLNKNWGKSYTLSNQANSLITYNKTYASDIGFNFRAPANGLGYTQSRSTWSGQFGVRYIF
jgi:hypothetical protein